MIFCFCSRQSKTSFANLGPELYNITPQRSFDDDNDNNFSTKLQLKLKTDEIEHFKEQIEEMRRKYNELATKTQSLESQKQDMELQKKKFEDLFMKTDRNLAEKERLLSDLEKRKFDSPEIKLLQKQISDLKETNNALEGKLENVEYSKTVNPSYSNPSNMMSNTNDSILTENLKMKVKVLEDQLEEMNKDRSHLSALKEELSLKIEESKNDVRLRDKALNIAEIQSKLEKKTLIEENSKAKLELKELNETKSRLNDEIRDLTMKLNEKTFMYEKLNIERLNLEKQMYSKERDDVDRRRFNVDAEISQLRDECGKLKEKLNKTEARLEITENEAKFTKKQIEERQNTIDELRTELAKNKKDFDKHLELFKKEKEEKEKLIKKCDKLEEEISKNIKEINEMKIQPQVDLAFSQHQQQPSFLRYNSSSPTHDFRERELDGSRRAFEKPPPGPSSQIINPKSPGYYQTSQIYPQPPSDDYNEFEPIIQNQTINSQFIKIDQRLAKTEQELFRRKNVSTFKENNNSHNNSKMFNQVDSFVIEEGRNEYPVTNESSKIKVKLNENI